MAPPDGMNLKQAAFAALRWAPATGIPAFFGRRFHGIGTIFGLHSVPAKKPPGLAFMRDMDVSAGFVRRLLERYDRRRYDILSMDGVRERLARRDGEGDPARRFIAFTFDDGYRNNFDVVYPLFREFGAPFTVHVATDLIDGKRPPVHALQDLVRARSSLDLEVGVHRRTLRTATEDEKTGAMLAVASVLEGLGIDERDAWLGRLLEHHGVDLAEATKRHMMSWDMVRELARSDLATIGAHTVSHVSLKGLDDERMRWEVTESKAILESRTGVEVRHFCYPYGGYDQVGEREFDFVTRCGFDTAVTTRTANVFAEHEAHRTALPRQVLSGAFEHLGIVETMESGLPSALLYGFRRVVTGQGGLKRML